MIVLEKVSYAYQTNKNNCFPVLKELSWSLKPGERWAVIGPSGCGKSTLLHLLSGLLQPDGGKILYKGLPLSGPQREISLLLQEYGLFPWKTVFQNVALPLTLQKQAKTLREETVKAALKQLGLWEQREKFPGQLSGGQRQRVAIARALVCAPQVLLMDEPFSALDALTRESLQQIVLELCRLEKLTLVLVTHNIEEASFLGEKILIFGQEPGQIRGIVENSASGAPDYRHTEAYYRCCNILREEIKGESR